MTCASLGKILRKKRLLEPPPVLLLLHAVVAKADLGDKKKRKVDETQIQLTIKHQSTIMVHQIKEFSWMCEQKVYLKGQ